MSRDWVESRTTGFDFIVVTPTGLPDPALAIAASRAGALGVLDLQFVSDTARALSAVEILARQARGRCGIKIDSRASPFSDRILSALSDHVSVAILSPIDPTRVVDCVGALRDRHLTVLLEAVTETEARLGAAAGVDGLIAKGHESGGRVGEETTFILLQRLLGATSVPVWAQGGIGVHSTAACLAAGAAGVVLDAQLALTRESTLPPEVKTAIARLDGAETVCVGGELGAPVRVFAPPGSAALAELQRFAARCEIGGVDDDTHRAWWDQVSARIGWDHSGRQVYPIGQEAVVAASLAGRFDRVAHVLDEFRAAADAHVRIARAIKPLDEGSPLARAHGTRYPIVQGPMTRVSDTAAFAARVASGGAVPFLALALLRAHDVERLLEETRAALAGRPWGVGILGFVPDDLRAEQLEVVHAHRPSMALIAGGRPDQAVSLEEAGVPTYLHVPSPGLLKLFIDAGSRRFVFEGRECGGHVGPRGSFALWDAAIDALLRELSPSDLRACHVLFAGGIHDARSASMVAALAAPIAERGAKVGVLLGTAYLFTHDAVLSGAIVEGFQRAALSCGQTVLLHSGPGHATRCAETPYAALFERERRRLLARGGSHEEIRAALESLNLGRLRLAAKGLKRAQDSTRPLVTVGDDEQHAEGMYMIGQVAALQHMTRTIEELHHDVSRTGSERLDRIADSRPVSRPDQRQPHPFDVAVIGMSCLLPKAPDATTYWDNILNKVDAVTEVPPDRWDWRKYYDPAGTADTVNSKWGGFLDPIHFDPTLYGMPPNSLASIEPLQLLTLEAVRAALEDANCLNGALPRERTAVILGVGGGIADLGQQYAVRSALPMLFDPVPRISLSKLARWSEDSFPGILPNVAAGRVANRFDFGGVNYTVDAACASSLAAVYAACRELEAGSSDVVVVGGADTIQNPFAYLAFAKTHALSPHGRCATFDRTADGIAISEGVAMMVLKRLGDAEHDGDRIYAVIKGVSGSSDGRAKGLTAPRPEGQALALERAYAQAGVSPSTVGLVEAHGTGTVAGDQAELETLNRVFGAAGAAPESCAIGSVKSNIGHTKSTAGVAGLIKVALALHHKVLPPTIHVSTPNPEAQRAGGALYVNTESRPWLQTDATTPRRAAVSAFGFGGTNFHAVLEEYTGHYLEADEDAACSWPNELLVWSGESRGEIQAALVSLGDDLRNGAGGPLSEAAYATWHAARGRSGLTLAMVVSSLDDLREKIGWTIDALNGNASAAAFATKRVFFSDTPLARGGAVAFLFPGQGSQYCGMLAELAIHFSSVHARFERATHVLANRLPRPLASYVFPPPRFRDEDRAADLARLTATTVAQPALGAADMALYQLLVDCSVRPDMVGGHSYGEYAALCAAGAFDEDTLYNLSEARGRCIAESGNGEPGAMAGVAANQERTAAVINAIDGVWVANINASSQTIISGRREAVALAIESLERAGIRSRSLPVACAFHSPLMQRARDAFAPIIEGIRPHELRVPVFSNVSAAPYPDDVTAIARFLTEQLVSPVRFADQIRAMYNAGARVFVEVGPAQVLSGLVDQILGDQPHAAVPMDVKDRPGLLQLQVALGQLAAHGLPLNLDPLFARRRARSVARAWPSTIDAEPQPSTAWIVTGGRATPLRPATQRPEPLPIATPNKPPDSVTECGPEPLHAPPPPFASTDDSAPAVLQFQQLMATFLETQREVMLAYLGAGPAADVTQLSTFAAVKSSTEVQAVPVRSAPEVQSATAVRSVTDDRTPDGVDVLEQLLAIVSDRTGYPRDLLGLDLNVEADLGIDSIKRVEIVGELGRRVLVSRGIGLHDVMTQLTSAKTLRTIADTARTLIDATRAPAASRPDDQPMESPQGAAAIDPSAVPRFLVAIADAPLPRPMNRLGSRDLVVITDDGRGVAEMVAAKLQTDGGHIAIVNDLSDIDCVTTRLESLRAQHGRAISGVLHLRPLGPSVNGSMDFHRVQGDLRSLFLLVHAAAGDLKEVGAERRGWVMAAAATGASSAAESAQLEAAIAYGALAGFIKTLAVEWPHVQSKVLDLEIDRSSILADRIVAEILSEADFPQIALRESRRLTPRPVLDLFDDRAPARLAIDSQDVLLVTGGARGITAAVAADLARRYRPTFVLVGRTAVGSGEDPSYIAGVTSERELKAALLAEARRTGQTMSAVDLEKAFTSLVRQREIRSSLDAIRRAGARVEYRQVDVVDDQAFGAVVEGIYGTYGRLDGVIHGAGVIEDALIEKKTPDSFERVFNTKVRSALTLVRHVRPESLKFLAFFASVAGQFGNRGQIDYAAANDSLNKLALHLDRRWPGRIVSLNWGPWAATGMASEAIRQQFIDRGITPIEVAAGCLAFDRELRLGRKGEVEVVLGGGRWESVPLSVSDDVFDSSERSSV